MGLTTGISWAHHTFNPWWGCTFVEGSPACAPEPGKPGAVCYAMKWSERVGYSESGSLFPIWGAHAERRYFGDKHWAEPLAWNRAAEKAGERRRVFCMSMGDWAEGRPDQSEHLARLWPLIKETGWLDWLMLTKRPQLIPALYPAEWQRNPLLNVWMGITTENQRWLDIRWPLLKRVDAAVYWLSMEPLFGNVIVPPDFLALRRRAWVIVGGQSGDNAVPMHPEWARGLRDQCHAAGVPYHFKQWGEFVPDKPTYKKGSEWGVMDIHGEYCSRTSAWNGLTGKDSPTGEVYMYRVGKAAAGHLLDGKEWHQFPEVA